MAMTPQINIYAFVIECLKKKTIPQRQVANESGVPFSTVTKLAQEATPSPSVHTVQKLFDYFVSKSIAPAGGASNTEIPATQLTQIQEVA